MNVEILMTLSLVAFAVAIILFIVSIVLFFILDIKRVVGELSGKTQRKAIETIRQQNETEGYVLRKKSSYKSNKDKVESKLTKSDIVDRFFDKMGSSQEREFVSGGIRAGSNDETSVLQCQTNMEPCDDYRLTSETEVLNTYNYQSTVILNQSENINVNCFIIDFEIGYLGSTEIIE